jgi:hypothetical protein
MEASNADYWYGYESKKLYAHPAGRSAAGGSQSWPRTSLVQKKRTNHRNKIYVYIHSHSHPPVTGMDELLRPV